MEISYPAKITLLKHNRLVDLASKAQLMATFRRAWWHARVKVLPSPSHYHYNLSTHQGSKFGYQTNLYLKELLNGYSSKLELLYGQSFF